MPSSESLLTMLAEFFEPEEARLWLQTPHKLLGERRPADLIAEGDSGVVLALVDQMRTGAYL